MSPGTCIVDVSLKIGADPICVPATGYEVDFTYDYMALAGTPGTGTIQVTGGSPVCSSSPPPSPSPSPTVPAYTLELENQASLKTPDNPASAPPYIFADPSVVAVIDTPGSGTAAVSRSKGATTLSGSRKSTGYYTDYLSGHRGLRYYCREEDHDHQYNRVSAAGTY